MRSPARGGGFPIDPSSWPYAAPDSPLPEYSAVTPPEQAAGVDSDGTARWVHVGGESWPGRVSRWRRDPVGWRGFVTYSRREPAGLLTYMHWAVAANLSPRNEDADHPAIPIAGRMSAGGHLDSIWTGPSLDHARGRPPERETGL